MSSEIPVIDFSVYGLDNTDVSTVDNAKVTDLASRINEALLGTGFCYLKNHGVSETLLSEYQQASRDFFQQPQEVKARYKRNIDNDYTGWVALEQENTNPKRPGDLKEAFNYCPNGKWGDWPQDLCPEFRRTSPQVFEKTTELASRILKLIAVGLKLSGDVTGELLQCHNLVGKPGNHTEIRALYFPVLDPGRKVVADQVRMGEHFSFGTICLMFQHTHQGLEKHRCVIPRDTDDRPHHSTLLYYVPNDYSIIHCLFGSEKYAAVSYLEHLDILMHAIDHS